MHCIVAGGSLSADGKTWTTCHHGFFLPVRVLSRIYRQLFLEKLNAYLSRYTHRIAVSNRRRVGIDDTHVAFTWRDYAHGSAKKVMRLDAHEFIRRFLLHVLPDGFQRIRHYGFLANGHRRAKLAVIRRCLDVAPPLAPTEQPGSVAASDR